MLSLLGHTGGVILEKENSFELNIIFEGVSPNERELINKLVVLGFYYKKIQEFIDSNNIKLVDEIILRELALI